MDHLLELLAYLHKSTFERSNRGEIIRLLENNRFFVINISNQKEKLVNKS